VPRLSLLLACLLNLVGLVSCIPAPGAAVGPTLWGDWQALGQTVHLEAAAVTFVNETPLFVWVAEEDGPPRLMASTLSEEPLPLDVAVIAPFDLQLLPLGTDRAMLLWRDLVPEGDGLRLRGVSVLLNRTIGTAALTLSDAVTTGYTAVALPGDGLRVVWSAGLLEEPDLFTLLIDTQGRPSFSERLARNGRLPDLSLTPEGTPTLFWLRDDQLISARLSASGQLSDEQRTSFRLRLNPGDYLAALRTAQDATHVYLFWQLVRADANPQVWWTSYPHGQPADAAPPRPLSITATPAASIPTGFNTGAVQAAQEGGQGVAWLRLLPGPQATIAAAIVQNDTLGMLYLRGGDLLATQSLTPTRTLSAPHLAADRDRHLIVSWSEPGPDAAQLRITTTR